jgi:NADPH-dependent 2,4-dienoyl-CoA reductase/sulfur reductase-like enzyme
MISSALIAHGIECFGHHPKDGAPQEIFCANGQCSHCLVTVDGATVKTCMTAAREGVNVMPVDGLPTLVEDDRPARSVEVLEMPVDVLIAGAGPAGLNAASELGRNGVVVILCDDKSEIGGKLTLQTHNFFGSVRECYAGTRGINIAKKLAQELKQFENVQVWLNSPVVGVFSDGKIGVVHNGRYQLIKPKQFLVATGARERALAFQGHDLPGVLGAGAFQTLVNRDSLGLCGQGFMMGPGIGRNIAHYIATGKTYLETSLFESLSPQRDFYARKEALK